ncbi:MAG: hypothetical protein ACE5R6_04890 [Candidatus Heimdallarchaeota archaeon]
MKALRRLNRQQKKVYTLTTGWRPSRGEKIRYFIVASFMIIVPVLGLLFLGLFLGRRVSSLLALFGAVLGGLVGLVLGIVFLYLMAINWEQMALEKLGKQRCPMCKQSFASDVTICPNCEYEVIPTTKNSSRSD